jgi:hypothetical protein
LLELNRINPSGGEGFEDNDIFPEPVDSSFQLNRINPSGGDFLLVETPPPFSSFQLNRINPSGGVKEGG